MAIRIIVREDDAAMAANVGGDVHTQFRTFDIEHAELERLLRGQESAYVERRVVGVELLPPKAST